jgi:hypothetical protein
MRTTRPTHLIRNTVCLVALAAVLWPIPKVRAESARKGPVLFSADEAARLTYSEDELRQVRRTRSAPVTLGPRIVIQRPDVKETEVGHTIETIAPTDLFVMFEPNRSPVDMRSLEIKARKGFFSKSLTDTLRPYIRGTVLQVPGADIPAGRFLIEIEIADRDGAKTVETYSLQVTQP